MIDAIIDKLFSFISNFNNVFSFAAILASIIMAIKVFADLSHIQSAFLDFKLNLPRLIKVYWNTRSDRPKLVRLYIELLIIRSSCCNTINKELFKSTSSEFIKMRNHDYTEIEVDDCFSLTTARFCKSVKLYFNYFSKPDTAHKYMIQPDEPISFVSTIIIKEGFLSPYVLIDGLIVRYSDSWPNILGKYRDFLTESNNVNSQDLSFLFSWLLWGPSWQPVFSKKHNAIFNYSFGDENNAIPVILPVRHNTFVEQWAENNSWGEYCEIKLKIYSAEEYIRRFSEFFTSEYQYTLQQYLNKGDDFYSIMEYQSHIVKSHSGESLYYCTAYLWIMLERVNSIFDPFSIEKCIVMFEHANLADNGHRAFLLKTLIDKTLANLIGKYEKTTGPDCRYRFCIASSTDVESAFRNRVNEMAKRDEYKYFSDFIITESARTPISILTAIDNVFNHGEDIEKLIIEEVRNDNTGIANLCTMYGQIFYPAFPNDDERESLENLIAFVRTSAAEEDRHIIILRTKTSILGCMVFTYFHKINAGYIAYIAVDVSQRKKGYAALIFNEGMRIMEQDAKRIKKSPADYVFLEIDKFGTEIPPYVHMWHNFGFKRINMDYIQPPLGINKKASDNLLLAVRSFSKKKNTAIPADDIKLFLYEFFTRSFDIPKNLIDEYVTECQRRLDTPDAHRLSDLIG